MLTSLRKRIYVLANLRSVILLWAIFTGFSVVAFNFGFLSKLEEHSQGNIILDNTYFLYTVEYVHQLFTMYGGAGRALYLSHLLVFDFMYPALFFVTNAASLVCLFNYLMPAAKIINHVHLLPLAPTILDYLENFGVLLLLASYPTPHPGVVAATSLTTIIKLSLVNILSLLTVALIAGASIKFIHQKTRNTNRPFSRKYS